MKSTFLWLGLFAFSFAKAQIDPVNTSGRNTTHLKASSGMAEANNYLAYHGRYYVAKHMAKPPIFPYGVDSIRRYYYNHFDGFDSLLSKAIQYGDTARYIRVYFEFVINNYGNASEAKFLRVAATQHPISESAKTITHFNDDKPYFDGIIKSMIAHMPLWRPGLAYHNVAVDAIVEDYFQFWVGIHPPPTLH